MSKNGPSSPAAIAIKQIAALGDNVEAVACIVMLKGGGMRRIVSDQPIATIALAGAILTDMALEPMRTHDAAKAEANQRAAEIMRGLPANMPPGLKM